jgi:hypothetical protein
LDKEPSRDHRRNSLNQPSILHCHNKGHLHNSNTKEADRHRNSKERYHHSRGHRHFYNKRHHHFNNQRHCHFNNKRHRHFNNKRHHHFNKRHCHFNNKRHHLNNKRHYHNNSKVHRYNNKADSPKDNLAHQEVNKDHKCITNKDCCQPQASNNKGQLRQGNHRPNLKAICLAGHRLKAKTGSKRQKRRWPSNKSKETCLTPSSLDGAWTRDITHTLSMRSNLGGDRHTYGRHPRLKEMVKEGLTPTS